MPNLKKPSLLAGALVLLGIVVIISWSFSPPSSQKNPDLLAISELSPLAAQGQAAFETTCAACHGINAAGTDSGPPLVHNIYNPGHHGDAAFYRAVKKGSPQHHWRFGNMLPQPQVSDDEIAAIIKYIRELQVANGIFYREHKM